MRLEVSSHARGGPFKTQVLWLDKLSLDSVENGQPPRRPCRLAAGEVYEDLPILPTVLPGFEKKKARTPDRGFVVTLYTYPVVEDQFVLRDRHEHK